MMRKILLLIGILIVGMSAYAFAASWDAPHNETNSFVCGDCHVYGNFPGDEACLSCHINTTGGGYSRTNAPKMLGHSSANTSTQYGTWATQCKDCHHPHLQVQKELYQSQTFLVTGTITSVAYDSVLKITTYGYSNLSIMDPSWADYNTWGRKSSNQADGNERGLIMFPDTASDKTAEVKSATSTTIKVTGNPGSVSVGSQFALIYGQLMATGANVPYNGMRNVRFYKNEGPNSFAYSENGAGTDATVEGICQVCHTQTQHWRQDGTLSAVGIHTGLNGSNCIVCHKHEKAFGHECRDCHGLPPVANTPGGPNGLVNDPAPTGSGMAGAHNKHVGVAGIDCSACHYNSKGVGPTHNDGLNQAVTMGFYLFGGAVQGGAYNGQSGVDYDTTVTVPATTVANPPTGAVECSNIYCHSTGQGNLGGPLASGDYKTPKWNASIVCGNCHKSDGTQGTATKMDTGTHTTHLNATNQLGCSDCHAGAGSGTSKHVNNLIEIAFTADPFSNASFYSQSPNTPGNGYGTCSTVYCHSSGQRSGGVPMIAGTSDYNTPSWGGTATTCGSCHASPMTTGSHTAHLTLYPSCSTCHNSAGSGTANHVNQNIEVEFSTGAYSQNPNPPGNGYGTCATTYCHGTSSPQWGTDLSATPTCEKCHGSASTAALGSFEDTSGSTTGAQVGAHVAHLASTHNYTNNVACSACHAAPGTVAAAGHIDSPLPAEVNVSLGFAGGTCSTSYCHGIGIKNGWPGGNNKTPNWPATNYLTGVASNDCAQCHGYPPGGGHPAATPSTCNLCHPGVNASGTGFDSPATHVDGTVQATGDDNCSSCHTNATLSAGHLKHTNPDVVLAGKKLSTPDYGNLLWWYSSSNTGGVPSMGCGYCHPQSSAQHMNGAKNLNFKPADTGASGTLKAKNDPLENYIQAQGTSVVCASVYCHSTGYNDGTGYVYQSTPDWYGGTFIGDKCANCHGNSPNSGGKPGSLSHYNPDAMGLGVVGGHFVGIHYKNVFTGSDGLIKDASLRQNAHGTSSSSTTISCNTCHYATVTASANDLNPICASCHASSPQGNMSINGASTTHVNGTPDVAFALGTINSKAQIRDNITGVAELNNSWTRNNGYKLSSLSSDGSKTAASYDAGTKSCSTVACHNGIAVQWGAPNVTCTSCHTSLP